MGNSDNLLIIISSGFKFTGRIRDIRCGLINITHKPKCSYRDNRSQNNDYCDHQNDANN